MGEANWHDIIGPNGMCKCGTENGHCEDRFKAALQSARATAYKECLEVIGETVLAKPLEDADGRLRHVQGTVGENFGGYPVDYKWKDAPAITKAIRAKLAEGAKS